MRRACWFALAAALGLTTTATRGQDEGIKARDGKFVVEEHGYFTRLVYDGTLIGTQVNETYLVRADAPNLFGLGTQWEALALVGAHGRWNPRLEPLSYYHRTGPVGAIFHHLRTRKDGDDAAAPVGVVGMNCGTLAAYAVRGQAFTFYSTHYELKDLVADSDEFFTYVRDARKRGATCEFRYGP